MIARALLLVLLVAVSGSLSDESIQLSESFGGPHGTEFSDEASVVVGQTIGSITIRAGERVDGISLEVMGPTAVTFNHGGAGGTENTLKLGAGDRITSMEVHWGKKNDRTRIFYLSFGTSAGNSISGGSMTEEKNSVTAPEGHQLGGFFGRGGNEIDSIGAIWARIEAVPAPVATEALPPATAAPTEPPAAVSIAGSATSGVDDPAQGPPEAVSTESSGTGSATSGVDDPAQGPPAAVSTESSATGSAASLEASSSSGSATDDPAPKVEQTEAPVAPTEAPASAISFEDSVQLSESFGGPHGTEFSDEATATSGQKVTSIIIRAGERVDGITLEIAAPTGEAINHGGSGGKENALKLGEGEYITSMEAHWGKKAGRTRIFYLSFGTSAGNTVSGGTQTEDKNTVTAPEGFQLGGFFGRGGDEIDSLGAIWTSVELITAPPAPAPAPAPAGDEPPGTVKPAEGSESGGSTTKRAIILSESLGGPHGDQFSDQPQATSAQTVSSITIRAGKRVDGLTLEISAPTAQTFIHGGKGGTENTLKLGPGEYITSMEAHFGKKTVGVSSRTRIFYLKFDTSAGNTVSAGTPTDEKGTVTAPEGYQLGGFFGRSGDEIDLIGVVWTSIEAVAETASPTSGDEDIQLSAVYGGPHGVAFSDMSELILGQTLSSVTLRGSKRVDAVTLQVATPAELTWGHGGSGGTENTLALAPGEYINSMEIHWGKKSGRTHVAFVNLITSEGNSVAAGTKTEQSATETAPDGFRLGGFYGRAEGEVDQLGAIWTRISAVPALLTDTMGTAWYGNTIRNWVGPTIGNSKDTACYRKTVAFDSKNMCPLGYGKDDDDCITQCPMAYPVECSLECIPQNDDCALNIAQKVVSVVAVAFNAATAGLFGQLKAAYNTFSTMKKMYLCASAVVSIIRSLIFYLRFTQTTAPQGDVEKLLAVAYQTDVIAVDLPVAVYSCLGMKVPPKLQWTGIVMVIVENIVKQAIINGEEIISSADNVIKMLTNTSAIKSPDTSPTELEDFIKANTSCGFELKQLTDRVIFAVSDVRNKTPNAAVDDIRVTISKSPLVLHDIPTVTNNCMKEMLVNKTEDAAFETRDLLRKTVEVIIQQLVDTATTDMGESVKEDEYMLEVTNLGLTVIGGLDPTGVVWMASQFVQPICGPTSFIGEVDDGTLYDALGLSTVDQAFAGSYGWWTKKGDGVVRLIFESTDKEDVTVVVHSGGDDYAEVQVVVLFSSRKINNPLIIYQLETLYEPTMTATKSPLLEWVAAHESSVAVANDLIDPAASVSAYGDDDRSIVAQNAFPSGSHLVTLSSGAFLNGTWWLEHYSGNDKPKLKQQIDTLQLSGTVQTTLALLAELARGEKSDFHGYIQQLPTAISLPFTWDKTLREMLRHTTAFPILDDKLVLSMYTSYAAPLMKEFPAIWPSEVSALEKFQWAYSIVSSRAFTVADVQEPTLLPVIDMANHTAEDPVAHIVETEAGSFQLTALRKAEKGEPVTISYGNLSNAQLLCRYGFVLPTLAPSDSIHITSSELTNAFKACSVNSEDEEVDDDQDEEDDAPQVGKGKSKATANPAKRRKLAHPENDNSLFFLLHGDAEREFGLGDALLSFVMASQLPMEQLYDVLAVLLQEKDKRYSDALSDSEKTTSEVKAIQQLCQHERQVCRRILLGLMSLEEGSDSSDNEE
uniref:Jacalin-type lectin domain-containing protein n=1 Tax=Phytophthora ramorum TaxID=164328 RepID=H3GBJ5_PHYRM